MSFSDRLRDLDQQIRVTPLNILIWGPRAGGTDYEKRVEIRDALRSYFAVAAVSLSEELADVPDVPDLTASERDIWHFAAADVCVVLSTTAGSTAEISHLVDAPMAHKLLILSPDHHKDLWPSAFRHTGMFILYTKDEYASSALVERVIMRVKQIALGKMLKLFV